MAAAQAAQDSLSAAAARIVSKSAAPAAPRASAASQQRVSPSAAALMSAASAAGARLVPVSISVCYWCISGGRCLTLFVT